MWSCLLVGVGVPAVLEHWLEYILISFFRLFYRDNSFALMLNLIVEVLWYGSYIIWPGMWCLAIWLAF
jgi:hypothetical protein